MKKILSVLIITIRVLIVIATALGLDLIIPFSSVKGIDYLQEHGKAALWLIALANIFIGSAFSAGFLSSVKNTLVGFRQWFMAPRSKNGQWNPTYGFAIFITAINIWWVLIIE